MEIYKYTLFHIFALHFSYLNEKGKIIYKSQELQYNNFYNNQ